MNKFINVFGIAQIFSIFIAPALGPYIDSDKGEHSSSQDLRESFRSRKIHKCNIALIITDTVLIILGITVLIPVLELQVSIIA